MKKLFIAALALLMTFGAWAVPAKRGQWKTLKTSDGIEVRVELRGDEFMNYWQTSDGMRYVMNPDSRLLERADMTRMAAEAASKRAVRSSKRRGGPSNVTIGGDHQPYVGHKKGLVVLVAFADMPFRDGHDVKLYNRILNEENFSNDMGFIGSVHDYFRDQSYGQFLLDFDIAGPVTMPKGYAYYGGNSTSAPNSNCKNIGEMLETALNAVDPVVDFSKYDWDGDGEVDQVFFLYAGRGEASGGGEDTIWPHEWVLRSALGKSLTFDGVTVDTYACGCEMASDTRIDGIGTICHEFSHCLGLADMYDTADGGNYGMCKWDLMDQGNYNGNSFVPSGYTSWERVYAGWKTPIELTGNTSVSGMKGLEDNGDVYIIRNDAHGDEYYMLENRQRTRWDAAQDGEGLLVVHVDFVPSIWSSNRVNSSASSHQHCTPIAADNRYGYGNIGGDVFPSGDNNSLTATSVPSASVYYKNTDGTYLMNKWLRNITKHDDGTISFDFEVGRNSNVFYESFDQCAGKGGNDGVFNSLGANKNVGSGLMQTDMQGWTYAKAGGANMCAMFTGSATTPEFDIPGRSILTFKAGPLTSGTNITKLDLSVSGSATLSETSLTMTSGKMTDFTVYIDGSGPVSLTFTPGNIFFLDEVKVKSDVTSGIELLRPADGPYAAGSGKSDGRIYSIDGRYMGTDASVLKSGMYIMNGRKFVKQ